MRPMHSDKRTHEARSSQPFRKSVVVAVVAVVVVVVIVVIVVVPTFDSHNEVHGRKTDSSHSGVEEYPRKNWRVH